MCPKYFEGILKEKKNTQNISSTWTNNFSITSFCDTLQFSLTQAAGIGTFHSIFEWNAFWEDGQKPC